MSFIERLENLLFTKLLLASQTRDKLTYEDKIVYDLANIRMKLWEITADRKQVADFNHFLNQINHVCNEYSNALPPVVVSIYFNSMKAFLFEVQTNEEGVQKEELQRKFIKELTKLPSLVQISNNNVVQALMRKSLYFQISLLQIYVKRNTRLRRKQQKAELDLLSVLIKNLYNKRKQTSVLCKRLYIIVLHLKLHNLNNFSNELSQQTLEFLNLCIQTIEGKQQTLINYDTVVVLLYYCLKVILGFNQLNSQAISILQRLYNLFSMSSPKRSYPRHILQLFFIIKIVIFTKKQQIQQNDKIQQKLSQFSQKFSVFLNLNMDQIVVSLNQITRNIIRHKVASLSTIIGIKLGLFRFSKDFLQIMHDSPFNNDVQTIKLCFQLFQFRQFAKIEYLLQTILSVPATKKLRMRQVLVAMISILIGLFLQNRQQGLLYNKLNHQNFLAMKMSYQNSFKSQILREETFLQHVGFGYYNIACHQVYLENRQIYLTKALENFLKSYELNSDNYLLNYCMGKLYLQMYDHQNAYKHAMQACKSHRGSWAPFCLLACIYICDRKFQKSLLLIQQLLKKYPQIAVLHYVRAYLQVNKILLQVQHDQQIQSAKILGDQFYLSHFQRLLKHKSISTLTLYCQNYFQYSNGRRPTEPDENFFSPHTLSANMKPGYNCTEELSNIIMLFEEVGQLNIVENLLKVMPQGSLEILYHKAIVHEKRKQQRQARNQYLKILKLNHSHCPSLIKLAQLPRSNDIESYKQCSQYLEVAGKYVNDGSYMLARGIVLSKLGRIDEANRALLTNRELGWCRVLPDLMYYYYG